MSTTPQTLPEEPVENRMQTLQASLRKLERRDWWMWVLGVAVMLLLTLAVISFSFPELLKTEEPFFQYSLSQAVRALVAVVLLFNTYSFYQQAMIKRLRRQLSHQLEVMNRLQDRAQQFEVLATLDPLTGLHNRRLAEQRLAAEAARSQRHGHPLTLVAFDLDNFKQINDRYGHLAGDEVLKRFAEAISRAIRASDLAARMGGDEFLVLLPECPEERVQAVLARLGPLEVDYQGHGIAITFSAGWVSYQRGETPEQFLERVDQTLYTVKRAQKARERALSTAP